MTQASVGNKVQVHYTGRLLDGRQFDSSEERDPLEFEIGKQQVIPGFENAVVGMEPGDNKTVTIDAEEAYGPRQDALVMNIGQEQIPDELELEVGQQLKIRTEDNQVMNVVVADISDDSVILDGNHPLAGHTLEFDIELVAVE